RCSGLRPSLTLSSPTNGPPTIEAVNTVAVPAPIPPANPAVIASHLRTPARSAWVIDYLPGTDEEVMPVPGARSLPLRSRPHPPGASVGLQNHLRLLQSHTMLSSNRLQLLEAAASGRLVP